MLSFFSGSVFILNSINSELQKNINFSDINELVLISFILGFFISIPGLIDIIARINKDNLFVSIFISATIFCVSLIIFLTYENLNYKILILISFIIGIIATIMSMSKTLRNSIDSQNLLSWTFAHIIGIGVIPFITGVIISYQYINSNSYSYSIIHNFIIPLLPLSILLITISILSSYKWIEDNDGFLNLTHDKNESIETKHGKNINQKTLLRYYFWSSLLFPITIFLIYFVNTFDGLFLILVFLSYLVILIGQYYYPHKNLQYRTSILSIRVVSIFLILFSFTFEFIFNIPQIEIFKITLESNLYFFCMGTIVAVNLFFLNAVSKSYAYYHEKYKYIIISLFILIIENILNRYITIFKKSGYNTVSSVAILIIFIFIIFIYLKEINRR